MRVKGIHLYDTGPVMEAFVAILRPFMTKKIKERVNLLFFFATDNK